MSRTVTLVLVDGAGAVLGALPPYRVPAPWWQDAREVVAGARERFGLAVVVLRLLSAQRAWPGTVRTSARSPGCSAAWTGGSPRWPSAGCRRRSSTAISTLETPEWTVIGG